jgi:hypothetical protein
MKKHVFALVASGLLLASSTTFADGTDGVKQTPATQAAAGTSIATKTGGGLGGISGTTIAITTAVIGGAAAAATDSGSGGGGSSTSTSTTP